MKRAATEDLVGTPNKKPKRCLETLLDVSGLASDEELAQRFSALAHELCNCTRLRLLTGSNQVEYSIAEVEFYLMKQGHHDPFCHGADAQKVLGQWYFHRAPKRASPGPTSPTAAGGFRGGTRKGLDLTFGGAPNSGVIGGILLRSVRRVSDDVLISGPSLLVDELLKQSAKSSIAALVASWSTLAAFSSSAPAPRMELVPHADSQSVVYSSPRIGLDLSHKSTTVAREDARVVFVARSYRFFVRPDTLTANGRMQTFVGVYEALLPDSELTDDPERALSKTCKLVGMKTTTGEEYARSYRLGVKSAGVKKFVGGKTTSPKLYLEMVGALRTYLVPAP